MTVFDGDVWYLHVDGASNNRGAGAGIVLLSSGGTVYEIALTIGFTTSNNKAEYKALIVGQQLAKHLGAKGVNVYSDSQLVVRQLHDDYNIKDPRMTKYYCRVCDLMKEIGLVQICWVGRDQNSHVDAFAALASAKAASPNRTIFLGEIVKPSYDDGNDEVLSVQLGPSWMDEILRT